MSYEQAKKDIQRLAKACRIAARQWEGGHPIGHDAICELHRALKRCVPELKRPAHDEVEHNDLAHEIAEESSKSLLECHLLTVRNAGGDQWLDLRTADDVDGIPTYIERAVRYLEVEGVLRRCPTDPQLIGWDEMDEVDV